MAKKRGAQPGNTNALKYGFYSRLFRQIELDDLGTISADLQSEIAALRVQARRLQDLIDFETLDTEQSLAVLNCLGAAFSRIATMLRTNTILTGRHSEFDDLLEAALNQVHKELVPPEEAVSDQPSAISASHPAG